jgi:hypothetical protein
MMVDRFNPVPEGSRSETTVHNTSAPMPCDEITPSDSISCVEVAQQRSENRVVEGRKNHKKKNIFLRKYKNHKYYLHSDFLFFYTV